MTNDLKIVRARVANLRDLAAKEKRGNARRRMETYVSAFNIVLEIINEYK